MQGILYPAGGSILSVRCIACKAVFPWGGLSGGSGLGWLTCLITILHNICILVFFNLNKQTVKGVIFHKPSHILLSVQSISCQSHLPLWLKTGCSDYFSSDKMKTVIKPSSRASCILTTSQLQVGSDFGLNLRHSVVNICLSFVLEWLYS